MNHKTAQSLKSGFTLIELLVVAAIIGILLALAIPNLIRARISANEVNARKSMQTLRDAEYEYAEQDLDENGVRDFTEIIGTTGTASSLRDPAGLNDFQEALIDDSFEGSIVTDGTASSSAVCIRPKAGYCISWSEETPTDGSSLRVEFGWEASASRSRKSGRKDFSIFADGVIRCTVTTQSSGMVGMFESTRSDPGCE